MNIFQNRYRDWLVPYVEGTLDARRRAKLEARLAQDPVLAAEAEAERRVSMRLRETAQAADETERQGTLWPSIQARLEPRRPSIRPLLLVGGLSAATATLIGAAVWGPLHPSPALPSTTQVASEGTASPVIIVVPPSSRPRVRYKHPRSLGSSKGKRLTVPRSLTAPVPNRGREEADPQDRLASAHSDVPDETGHDSTPSAPKFAPGSKNFRLTGNEHPPKIGDSPEMTPTDPNTAGSSDTPADGGNAADTPPNHAEETTPPASPGTEPASSGDTAGKAATTPRHSRHRRHHGHIAHGSTPPATEHGGTPSGSTDGSATSQGTPAPPKRGTKPVE